MLGVPCSQFRSGHAQWSSRGRYVKKHEEKYIFYFHDLRTKKNIIVAQKNMLVKLQSQIPNLKNVRPDRLPKSLQKLRRAYADLDLGLPHGIKRLKHRADVRRLGPTDRKRVKAFLKSCSAADRDTLDLQIKSDSSFGVFYEGNLAGLARYAKIPGSPKLADVTVLVHKSYRGMGLGTPLVYQLVKDVLTSGLIPKYRVGTKNAASQAIARRLGFKAQFLILTFKK